MSAVRERMSVAWGNRRDLRAQIGRLASRGTGLAVAIAVDMSAAALFNTLPLVEVRPTGLGPAPSMADRLQTWLAGKSRLRLVAAEREVLNRHWPHDRGDVLTLDWSRAPSARHVARLRSAPDRSVDTVVSVGSLAGATDVKAMLTEIKRVLRPAGRLLFVEPVAAGAGTWLRRLQGIMRRTWRMAAGGSNDPRDLWNDMKAARFDRLTFDRVNLPGLGGLPVPHLVGDAVLPAAARPTVARPRNSTAVVPHLVWREQAFAFFGS